VTDQQPGLIAECARPRWRVSYRADPLGAAIADRHYNRQKIGSKQFVPPGACLVLLTPEDDALWVTSAPKAEYVQHAWAGAWMNSCFRNEGPHLSSSLIREAVAVTRWRWPEVPALGMVSFVDAKKTRQKRDPGYCYRMAGFVHVGFTKSGLWAFQMTEDNMPEPMRPNPKDGELWAA
jgi:hypothetical protein